MADESEPMDMQCEELQLTSDMKRAHEEQVFREEEKRARELLDYAAACNMDKKQVQELLNRNKFEGAADIDDLGEAGFKARIWGPYNTIISV